MTHTRFKSAPNLSLALAVAIGATLWAREASARRGPDFMNSPGYQRALAESRKQREIQRPTQLESRPDNEPRRAKRKSPDRQPR